MWPDLFLGGKALHLLGTGALYTILDASGNLALPLNEPASAAGGLSVYLQAFVWASSGVLTNVDRLTLERAEAVGWITARSGSTERAMPAILRTTGWLPTHTKP